MKQILIVFCGLLVLLTLISTFGGSIRVTENFVDVESEKDEEKDTVSVDASPTMMETFYQDALSSPAEEHGTPAQAVAPAQPVTSPVPAVSKKETEVKPAPPVAEGFRNFEKFEDFPEDARPFDLFGCRSRNAEREDEFEELFAVKPVVEEEPKPLVQGHGQTQGQTVEGFSGCMYATCGGL